MLDNSLNYSSGNSYGFPAPLGEIFFTIHAQNQNGVAKITAAQQGGTEAMRKEEIQDWLGKKWEFGARESWECSPREEEDPERAQSPLEPGITKEFSFPPDWNGI